MHPPESQLETWSHQGSVAQSAATYQAVKRALEDPRAPYAVQSFNVFLQGSYANDTNIYADSDVDVVICLTSTYYHDDSGLSESEKGTLRSNFSPATYNYAEFKREVLEWLKYCFGNQVSEENKAIYIPSDGTRREADVLVAAEYRKYNSYYNININAYHEGITFWTKAGKQIVNYPGLHSRNCTVKHQNTYNRFKPCVRVLKNMRNKMCADGLIPRNLAPSYFLEGMLWNVPNDKFVSNYVGSIANALNWLNKSDREKLVCANDMYYLLHPTSPVTWRIEKFESYLTETILFWNKG